VVQELATSTWRQELPPLTGRLVTLREPTRDDVAALVELLTLDDASRFGIDEAIDVRAVQLFVDRALRDRAAGAAVTFVITVPMIGGIAGLVQVRALDPAFESAEWDVTLAPAARGSRIFVETARLAIGFAFHTVGAHRVEARVQVQNGRGNGALRKLGAVQEGILRRSARRRGEYVDQVLWSLLKEDWGEPWVAASPRVH
jgi:RimJ/RimL family protein N-acetyltransferase